MSYSTEQDLIDRYSERELIQLTDHDSLGVINATVLDRAITDADGEIDGYLSVKFSVPLATVPKVIKRIACAITRYYLYDDNVTEHVSNGYKDAIAYLKGVAKGEIQIGIDEAGATPATHSNTVQMESPDRVFDRKNTGFI